MGKGDRPTVLRALGRGLGVRLVPGRTEPLRVWHYTSTLNALDIERDCLMLPGTRGTDGPGVYFTDLAPSPDRLRISMTLWERWRPQSMEAFVGLPFLSSEMEPSEKYPHIWVVKESELRLTGLENLEIGFWQGSDPSAADDQGSWVRRRFPGCR